MTEDSYLLLAQVLLISLVLLILWLIYKGTHRILSAQHIEKAEKISTYLLAGLICWLLLTGLVSLSGFFTNFEELPPRIALAMLPPVFVTIYLLFSKKFARFLELVPERWFIYPQSFRFPLEVILWLGFLGGAIPFQMTFEGFNFDIIVGLTAYIAGFVFFAPNRYRRFEAIIWNIFGLVLLVNIVAIAIVSTPSPFRIFMNEPANRILAYFPFIWVPGFLVPLAFALHVFSLKQLIFMSKNKRRKFTLRKD
ncbi:MAG: hypothetical protein ACI8YQ_001613 [Polaribacter sp.]|jgi:hypothetical protein